MPRNESARRYRENNRAKCLAATRWSQLKTKYGITKEEYFALVEEQDGYCAICSVHLLYSDEALAVDHDHETGVVRGLLCRQCNLGLGNFSDNINKLKNAIAYLEEFSQRRAA